MNRKEIEFQIMELQLEYRRLQDDMEKLESFGRSIEKQEARLLIIEKELQEYQAMKKSLV
ncbi:SE1832 family protein [Cytobacillus sp. FJAT-54145]|uniref:SE1832 family protein n=1 Tax=Cytobacillus spartinae TaxID=3299023 RepID=A0ABW6K946_9BACI